MTDLTLPEARSVSLDDAVAPFVLALDIGSGSTRCSLYDAFARPVKKRTAKAEHLFVEKADGTAEIASDALVDEVADVITQTVEGLDRGSISAIAMDTFASSLICVDASGDALTPCITYADGRSAPQLARLRESLDEAAVHQRVGTRLHTSYHPPRLLWLRDEFPDIWNRTTQFLSLGEYVYQKLAGISGAATSTMAWAGILNRHTHALDEELLNATGARPEQFAAIIDPDEPIRDVSPEVERRWPALAGAAWFPAIPDGFASNLGVGAQDPTTAGLSAATSGAIRVVVPNSDRALPTGLWSYTLSRKTSLVGGALNDVGRVMDWLDRTLAPVDPDELDARLRAPAEAGTPLVLPFLTGERSTRWAGDARAIFTGVTSSSTPLDLWRAATEGVAVSYARVFQQLREVNPDLTRVIASGGVAHRRAGVIDVVAQAFGFPVQAVDVKRVTMRGTAVYALSTINPDHPVARIPDTALIQPDPTQKPYYEDLQSRFEKVYDALIA